MTAGDLSSTWTSEDGLLLVGHGTRNAEGVAEAVRLSQFVAAQLPDVPVRLGFLELAGPNIADSFSSLVAEGVRRITVSPLLLLAAGHAKQDVPNALGRCLAAHPQVSLRLAAHLGCHQKLLELSQLRFRQACERHFDADAGEDDAWLRETLLLMVGRGSHDPGANSQLAAFARLRWEQQPLGWQEICFAAMARPSLEEALEVVARLPFARVVVQPHLLFQGDLLTRIRRSVEEFAEKIPAGSPQIVNSAGQRPSTAWVVADHLGPDELLALAIVQNACQAVSFIAD